MVGWKFFKSYFATYWFLTVPILIYLAAVLTGFRSRNVFVFIVSACLYYFVLIANSGADNYSAFPFWRHPLHVLPVIYFLDLENIAGRLVIPLSIIVLDLSFALPVLLAFPKSQAQKLNTELLAADQIFPSFENKYDAIAFFS